MVKTWLQQEAIEKSVLKLIDFGLAREFKLSLRLQGLTWLDDVCYDSMLFARS